MKRLTFFLIVLISISLSARAETFTNLKGVSIEGEIVTADINAGTVTLHVPKMRKDFELKIADLSPQSGQLIQQWWDEKHPKPAEWVEAGASKNFEFPELGNCNHDDSPLNANVYVPNNYAPDKAMPLLVWLTGGKGGNAIGGATSLAGMDEFICVALPYPSYDGRDIFDRQTDGGLVEFWQAHASMLDAIEKEIPNIDPNIRVIAGFSNGAHSIGGYLSQVEEEIAARFNVFVFADGGVYEGNWSSKHFEGDHAYCCWGEVSTNKKMTEATADCCESAKMIVTRSEMAETPHQFTPGEKTKVQTWLLNTVLVERRAMEAE